jgi:membrane-bound inhibitor of C-type lysozyme
MVGLQSASGARASAGGTAWWRRGGRAFPVARKQNRRF